jgi:hypothetical protein
METTTKKGQSHYSLETLKKIYDKILKTPSKKMSEPSKYKLGGKTKQADITEGNKNKLPPFLKKKMVKSDKSPGGKKVTPEEKAKLKKKGGCMGPKYMCGGKKKSMKSGGLYDNIHAKRKSGETMRSKGDKGAPSEQDFKNAAKTAKK